MDLALQRLEDSDLVYVVGRPEFIEITANHLGVAATPADGFEAMHAAVVRELSTDDAGQHELDAHLAAAAFTPGAIAGTRLHPVFESFDKLSKAGDHDQARLAGEVAVEISGLGTSGLPTPPPSAVITVLPPNLGGPR